MQCMCYHIFYDFCTFLVFVTKLLHHMVWRAGTASNHMEIPTITVVVVGGGDVVAMEQGISIF